MSSKEITYFIPNGYRYMDIPVETEGDLALISQPVDETIYRLWKHGPAWTGRRGVRFLAVDGEPVTAIIDEYEETRWASIKDFLTLLWGQEVLDKLPPALRGPLEAKWLSQITVVPVDVDAAARVTLDEAKADIILWDNNIRQFQEAGKYTEEKSTQDNIVDFLMKAAVGGFVVLLLIMRGVLKV